MGERDGLKVQGVSKSFKTRTVLRNATLEVRRQEVVLLRGPNGSGKSTLVHLIAGVYNLDQGDIWIDGISLKREPRRAKAAVTTAFQETLFDPLSCACPLPARPVLWSTFDWVSLEEIGGTVPLKLQSQQCI